MGLHTFGQAHNVTANDSHVILFLFFELQPPGGVVLSHWLQLQGETTSLFRPIRLDDDVPAEEEAPPISSVLIVLWRVTAASVVTLQRCYWSTLVSHFNCTKQPPEWPYAEILPPLLKEWLVWNAEKSEEHEISALSSWRWLARYLYMDIYSKLPE